MSLQETQGAAMLRRTRSARRFWVPGWVAMAAVDVPILMVFGLLIVLPLLTVLAQAVMPALFDPRAPGFGIDLTPLRHALVAPRVVRSILHSVELGAAVAVTATLVGGIFAALTQRFRLPLRAFYGPVPWLVFLTPAYLKALAWVLLMAPGGYLAQLGVLPHWASDAFFGLGGLVFVHTLSLFPLPAFILGSALAGLGQELEDAGRMAGAGTWRIWRCINLPLLMPAIALCLIATFAEVLSDFGLATTIAKTSGFGVLTYGIYAAASDYPVDFPLAGAEALVLLTLILLVTLGDRLLRRQGALRLISGRSRRVVPQEAGPRMRWLLTGIVVLIGVLALWLPLAVILVRTFTATLGHGLEASNFTLSNLTEALTPGAPALQAMGRSFMYAALTALIASSIALILAARLDRAGPTLKASVTGFALGTIAIPGIVLGFGYILVWNRLPGFRDWPFPHYGQASLLVTGYVAAALPYCLIIILTAVGQLAPSLTDSARLHGHGAAARLIKVVLPLVLLSVITAVLLTFIRTVFELPVSQLLVPQTGSPVPPYVVRLLGHDDDGAASALALLCMVGAGGLAGAGWLIARRYLTFDRKEVSP
ncbi:MAG: ABC transporter permease [Cypionkella sp.]